MPTGNPRGPLPNDVDECLKCGYKHGIRGLASECQPPVPPEPIAASPQVVREMGYEPATDLSNFTTGQATGRGNNCLIHSPHTNRLPRTLGRAKFGRTIETLPPDARTPRATTPMLRKRLPRCQRLLGGNTRNFRFPPDGQPNNNTHRRRGPRRPIMRTRQKLNFYLKSAFYALRSSVAQSPIVVPKRRNAHLGDK